MKDKLLDWAVKLGVGGFNSTMGQFLAGAIILLLG